MKGNVVSENKLPGGDAQVNPLRHNKQGIINESPLSRKTITSRLTAFVKEKPTSWSFPLCKPFFRPGQAGQIPFCRMRGEAFPSPAF